VGVVDDASSTPAAARAATLAALAERCRALAGRCGRAVRLDLALLVAFQLHHVAGVGHVIEADGARELHPSVAGLSRAIARLAGELGPLLAPRHARYAFGVLPAAVAAAAVAMLPELAAVNALGVERMVRLVSVLQAPVVALLTQGGGPLGLGPAAGGAAAGTPGSVAGTPGGRPGPASPGGAGAGAPLGSPAAVAAPFERAAAYYALLAAPPEEVVRCATEAPLRHSPPEWQALLAVTVPGRVVTEAHGRALFAALDRAYQLSAGQRVAEVLGTLRTGLQGAPETITGARAPRARGLARILAAALQAPAARRSLPAAAAPP